MAESSRMIVKANQHYQLTIPSRLRGKMSIEQGTLFSVLQAQDGILFSPLKFLNGADVCADEMDAEEIQEIKDAMRDIKTGQYTKIETRAHLKEHLDALKQ
jgi:bifunctional DNA-binding transcriptional regulator/antitoxin component of YhaV-PrlF toxin-antitoxin module